MVRVVPGGAVHPREASLAVALSLFGTLSVLIPGAHLGGARAHFATAVLSEVSV
jgi:hypothetical protein